MKKFHFLGLLAVLLAVGLAVGCSGGSGAEPSGVPEPQTGDETIYTATRNSISYKLTIIEKLTKAAYDPKVGDYYKLDVNDDTSSGDVLEVGPSGTSGLKFTLKPPNGDSFTVTVSGQNITNITGTITFENDETLKGPGSLTSGGGGGGSGGSGTGTGTGTGTSTAPSITTTSLSNGVVGTAYSRTMAASGTAPITWSVSGAPPGLSINASGVLSGTPTTAGSYPSTFVATNSVGSDTKAISITIDAAPTPCNCLTVYGRMDHMAVDEASCGCGASPGQCTGCSVRVYGTLPIGVGGININVYRAQGATDAEITAGDTYMNSIDTVTNIQNAYGMLLPVTLIDLEGEIGEIHIIPAAGGLGVGGYWNIGGKLVATVEADMVDGDIYQVLCDISDGTLLPTIIP